MTGREWSAVMVRGRGLATVLHGRRGSAFEAVTGPGLFPGTLNLSLTEPFAWESEHVAIMAPEPGRWDDLSGAWGEGGVRLYPVWIMRDDLCLPGWVVRLDSSGAALNRVEVVAFRSLREAFGDGPVTLALVEPS